MEAGTHTFALSFAQERLWFLHQLAPDSPFYNLQIDIPISIAVDHSIWQRLINEIVHRHEILRTVFGTIDGRPVQHVLPALEVPVAHIDLRERAVEEREERAAQLGGEDGRHPFDLTRGPLMRVSLIRLADEVYLCYLTMHHIVTDGWSMDVLLREIATLYDAFAAGEASPLPELPIQYADFAVWQRKTQSEEDFARQLAHWRRQLADCPAFELPTDFERPSPPSYRGGFQLATTPASVVECLRGIGQAAGATLFMTLLAAFQILMMRYAGKEDIAVGTPIANRTRPELEPLIGFFVNTLVMRGRLEGQPTFHEYLRGVREVALAGYANQDVPFERLVEELHPQRDLSRNPIFQVMFVLQGSVSPRNGSPAPLTYQAGATQSGVVAYGTSKFDLTLYLTEDQGALPAIFEYSTDLFRDDTIANLIAHWQMLLQSIAADPNTPVQRLPLLPPRERLQLLDEWNRTARPYPKDATLASLFREQVVATPQALAVNGPEGALTYEQLARRANRLSRTLQARGVAPGDLVGISLPRSNDMIIAALAIIGAGAAYLPLDPSYPRARLEAMIGDAEPRLIVSRSDVGSAIASQSLVLLDVIEWASDDSPPEVPAGAQALAYVLYTSGSTGTPKGVCVTHRNVVRLVRNTNYCEFRPDDVILQFAPLQFDASTFEIWGALLNGARLEVGPAGLPSLEELAACIERGGVTILWLTASLFHQLVEAQLGALWRVRLLLSGGDVLSPRLCQRVLDELPNCMLVNGYGPTETTTFATCHRMSHGEQIGARVPIGRAVSNTQLYVLDDQRQLVPTGVVGELYIGGDGVSAGYLNDPALTAERFITSPFAPQNSGARLYRTGDQVRFRADGALEFRGRRDYQVKLRGFRIELEEIEAVMRRHPLVRDACVVLRGRDEEARLIGFVVLERPQVVQEVRRFLQQELPDYMVPAHLVPIERLPLTPNGKVDRHALPVELESEWSGSVAFSEPRSEMECLVAAVWCEVLGIERAGLHDNFFDLGGHSLLLAQAHSRLTRLLGQTIAMVDLFRFPTVESLAAHLGSAAAPPDHEVADPLDLLADRVARQRQARQERRQRRGE